LHRCKRDQISQTPARRPLSDGYEEHVESTFKEDAAKRIREQVGNRAIIREGEPVSRHLSEIIPDMVLQAADRDPVAIFFSQSSPRVYEAMILQMDALYVAKKPLSVIALLEAENSISRDMQKKASNRLAAVTFWRDDEIASVQRIEREVVGLKNIPH
jgi:hypothetical protein